MGIQSEQAADRLDLFMERDPTNYTEHCLREDIRVIVESYRWYRKQNRQFQVQRDKNKERIKKLQKEVDRLKKIVASQDNVISDQTKEANDEHSSDG